MHTRRRPRPPPPPRRARTSCRARARARCSPAAHTSNHAPRPCRPITPPTIPTCRTRTPNGSTRSPLVGPSRSVPRTRRISRFRKFVEGRNWRNVTERESERSRVVRIALAMPRRSRKRERRLVSRWCSSWARFGKATRGSNGYSHQRRKENLCAIFMCKALYIATFVKHRAARVLVELGFNLISARVENFLFDNDKGIVDHKNPI